MVPAAAVLAEVVPLLRKRTEIVYRTLSRSCIAMEIGMYSENGEDTLHHWVALVISRGRE